MTTRRHAPRELLVVSSFEPLADPRISRTRRHPLINILTIVLAATLAGAKGWDDMVEFALSKWPFFLRFLDGSSGVPSADTLRRVFERLDPKVFAQCFATWTSAVERPRRGAVVAIDGKSQHGSTAVGAQGYQVKPVVHMVSAWAAEKRMVLAAVPTDCPGSETVQIKELLSLFELRGATVTVDAIGCRGDSVAKAIRERGAHYLIALKRNAKLLFEFVSERFDQAKRCRFRGIEYTRSVELTKAHGRREKRTVWAIAATGWEHPHGAWSDVATLVRVDRVRTRGAKVVHTTHYFVTSLRVNATTLATRIRRRWSTENEQHWRIDVAFDEDDSKIQTETSATNLAFVRRIALNLHLAMPEARGGLPRRIKRAGWDDEYLGQLLSLDIAAN